MKTLAKKLHPDRFPGMSPKMAAVLGVVLDYDYGARYRSLRLVSLFITSDGFLVGWASPDNGSDSDGHSLFIGSATDWEDNLSRLIRAAELSEDETRELRGLVDARITDYRTR